jgi:hypothetical protein
LALPGGILWSSLWQSIGKIGSVMDRPVVVSPHPFRIDVFAYAGDNARLYVNSWNAASAGAGVYTKWGGWNPLLVERSFAQPSGVLTAPAVVFRKGTSIYDIFAVDKNGAVYHRSWDFVRSPVPDFFPGLWQSMGGSMVDIVATSGSPKRVELFARGMNGLIYHLDWSFDPLYNLELQIARMTDAERQQFQALLSTLKALAAAGITTNEQLQGLLLWIQAYQAR